MKRVFVVLNARPNYTRVKGVLELLKNSEKVDLKIVTVASINVQKYGRAVDVIRKDGFEVYAELDTYVEDNPVSDMAMTTAKGLFEFTKLLERDRPDAVIVIADRFEILATAIAASYMNIPLIHIQGGEKTGSIDNRVRHAVTKLSDYHLVSNTGAKRYVEQLDEDSDRILVAGCVSIDVARRALEEKVDDRGVILECVTNEIDEVPKRYMIVLIHGDTTEYRQREKMAEVVRAIEMVKEDVFWVMPDMDGKRAEIVEEIEGINKDNVYFVKNFPPEVFVRLIDKALCFIGNSSTGIREAGFLGVPSVNIGKRQVLREKGHNVFDVDYNTKEIYNKIEEVKGKRFERSYIYGDGYSSEKIAKFLEMEEFTLKDGKE